MVQEALEVVQKRVSEQRLCNLVSLLRYLDDAKNLSVPDDEFRMPSRKAMIRIAKLLLSHLFQTNAEEDMEVVEDHVPLDDGDKNQQLKCSLKSLTV